MRTRLTVICLQVHDLLNPDISQIRIQHDPKLGTVLSGVKEQVVMNPAQVTVRELSANIPCHYRAHDMFSTCDVVCVL